MSEQCQPFADMRLQRTRWSLSQAFHDDYGYGCINAGLMRLALCYVVRSQAA